MNEIPNIIFFDLDGTLLNSKHRLNATDAATLSHQREKLGFSTILATGRPPSGIKKIYQQLNLSTPVIALNGALILEDLINNQVIAESTIDADTIASIVKKINHLDLSFHFLDYMDWFSTSIKGSWDKEEAIFDATCTYRSLEALIAKWNANNKGPNKFEIIGDPDQLNLVEICLAEELHIIQLRTSLWNLEIIPTGINKAKGAQIVIDHLSMENPLSWAFGDNVNDLELLVQVDRGIVMQNHRLAQVPETLDITRYSNDESGVTEFIHECFY